MQELFVYIIGHKIKPPSKTGCLVCVKRRVWLSMVQVSTGTCRCNDFISVDARGLAMSCDEFKIADLIKLLIENDIQ